MKHLAHLPLTHLSLGELFLFSWYRFACILTATIDDSVPHPSVEGRNEPYSNNTQHNKQGHQEGNTGSTFHYSITYSLYIGTGITVSKYGHYNYHTITCTLCHFLLYASFVTACFRLGMNIFGAHHIVLNTLPIVVVLI